uniref:U3 small nucleolar RNA-associated protein 14 A n=1 Tax=Lygus hesperus TaxID=30085 RepID=A0A146MGL4_LYGHE
MAASEWIEGEHEDEKEDDIDDHSHKKLLNAVSQIYRKQRIAAPKRNEPFLQISEFNLTKSDKKRKVGPKDLLRDLNKKATHHQITKKIQSIQSKVKPLPKPLERHEAEKLSRQAGFNTVKEELWKWEALIQRNRAADQLVFPLKDETVKFERDADFLSTFTKPSELELKMAEAMKKSLLCLEGKADEEPDEKMTLQELFARRNMVAKMRARESYRIAKAVRQNKIKSKKYHRLLKRDRIKKELKEFELLQKTDPEAALAKLERVEKARAEERISLRHRNTGKWAKGLALRAKYDTEARAQLADNLKKSREITEKLKSSMASDSEDEDDEDLRVNEADKSGENPWVADNEVASFVSGYRKFWEEQNKQSEESDQKTINSKNEGSGDSPVCDSDEDGVKGVPAAGFIVNGADDVDSTRDTVNTEKAEDANDDRKCDEGNVPRRLEDESSDEKEFSETSTTNTSNNVVDEQSEKTGNFVSSNPEDGLVPTPRNKVNKEKTKSVTKCLDKSGMWSVVEINGETGGGNVAIQNTKEEDDSSSGKKRKKTKRRKRKSHKIAEVSSLSDEPPHELDEKSSADKKRKLDDMFEQVEMAIDEAIPDKIAKIKNIVNPSVQKSKVDNKTATGNKSHHMDLSFKNSKAPMLDESLIETGDGSGVSSGLNNVHKLVDRLNSSATPKETKLPDIDPQKFIPVKRQKLDTAIPDFEEGGDSESDDEAEEQHLNLMEAFADDDIADEFRKEKEEEEEDFKEKEIDLSLPGWGSWGGSGITPWKNRRKKRVVKFPKIPRKDANKNIVIINEEPSAKFTKLMVNDLPQQFKDVAAYEAAIRAPIGDTWVTQSAHNSLIAPQVITKMGAIIEPLDASVLLKKEEEGEGKKLKVNGPLGKSSKRRTGVKKNSGKNNGNKNSKNGPSKKGDKKASNNKKYVSSKKGGQIRDKKNTKTKS